MRWLSCIVGTTRVHVRADDVHSLIEYRVGPPPPLVSTYLVGIGILDDQLVMSVRVGLRPRTLDRVTKGVMLVTPASTLRWVLEVDSMQGFVSNKQVEPLTSEPAWLIRSTGGERFLDVAALVFSMERA
ncbi:MAG: hypothetical protein ACKV2T_09160 [Kofleriaceae bacterium]